MRLPGSVILTFLLLACGGGGDNGPPTGNSNPVATVTVSGVGNSALEIGASRSVSATLRDAGNTVLTGRAVSWSVVPQGIVSLSAATGGTINVTGVAAGDATLTAMSEGKSGEASIEVAAANPAPSQATVTLTAASFDPSEVRLKVGGTVTWVNSSGGVLHNVTFASPPAGVTNIGNHTQGSNSRSFSATGAFDYECTNHSGMTGTITVVP